MPGYIEEIADIGAKCRRIARRFQGYETRLRRGSMTKERYIELGAKAVRELVELQLIGMELLRQAADAIAEELEGDEEDERRKLP
ncbi:hypothetical protein [Neomoorella thermoacetica]|nr:hypothetical protein [Moorella thermoacetica]